MASITRFLERRLKLRVNTAKSAVASPTERKFLGFSFMNQGRLRRSIAPQALARFKKRVRELTPRTGGRSLAQIAPELSRYLMGWRGYFGFCETPSQLRDLDRWIRRRLRAIVWKQWKYGTTALRNCAVAVSGKIWRHKLPGVLTAHGGSATARHFPSRSPMPSSKASVLPLSTSSRSRNPTNRRIRTRTYGGVGGEES